MDATVTGMEEVLSQELDTWPVGAVGAAVVAASGPLAAAGDDGQIGRASCRERVCYAV